MKIEKIESITMENASQYGPVNFHTIHYSDELAKIVLSTNRFIKKYEKEFGIENDNPSEEPITIERYPDSWGYNHGECTIKARTLDDFMQLFEDTLEYIGEEREIF